jgi:hypothetical protein
MNTGLKSQGLLQGQLYFFYLYLYNLIKNLRRGRDVFTSTYPIMILVIPDLATALKK